MRYFLAAAIMMAMLKGPAYAQFKTGDDKTPLDYMYEREAKEKEENEKAYNAQMKRLKIQAPATTNSDPWKTVRPAEKR
jgi:hypothetical protein